MDLETKRSRFRAWMIILPLSLALIAAGLYQGDYRSVMNKAILICLECIGIG